MSITVESPLSVSVVLSDCGPVSTAEESVQYPQVSLHLVVNSWSLHFSSLSLSVFNSSSQNGGSWSLQEGGADGADGGSGHGVHLSLQFVVWSLSVKWHSLMHSHKAGGGRHGDGGEEGGTHGVHLSLQVVVWLGSVKWQFFKQGHSLSESVKHGGVIGISGIGGIGGDGGFPDGGGISGDRAVSSGGDDGGEGSPVVGVGGVGGGIGGGEGFSVGGGGIGGSGGGLKSMPFGMQQAELGASPMPQLSLT